MSSKHEIQNLLTHTESMHDHDGKSFTITFYSWSIFINKYVVFI